MKYFSVILHLFFSVDVMRMFFVFRCSLKISIHVQVHPGQGSLERLRKGRKLDFFGFVMMFF